MSTAADERQLDEFGSKQALPRVLRLWTNWAIGFAFISPIVGLYTAAVADPTPGADDFDPALPPADDRQPA